MKFITGILLVILLSLTFASKASAELPSQVVDESFIVVPENILMGIQLQYQGYAVNETKKEGNNYRLRVDRDSGTDDQNGWYLIYNSNWILLYQNEIPSPPKKEEPKKEEEKKKEEPRQEERRNDSNRGNGNNKPDKPDKPNKPDKPPSKPPEDPPQVPPNPNPEPEPNPEPTPEPQPEPTPEQPQ